MASISFLYFSCCICCISSTISSSLWLISNSSRTFVPSVSGYSPAFLSSFILSSRLARCSTGHTRVWLNKCRILNRTPTRISGMRMNSSQNSQLPTSARIPPVSWITARRICRKFIGSVATTMPLPCRICPFRTDSASSAPRDPDRMGPIVSSTLSLSQKTSSSPS